ncbi:hypothetical protein COLO4_07943 [Corchorus olitorius]|uniref:Uncharacterized protein n=1 Tax=Corchorus olitorius TaxID=93759 RepID=A0A1R3KI20_9ROSI|nr:hypothetical protein COLO4_07943 [Corchorus olitorius]
MCKVILQLIFVAELASLSFICANQSSTHCPVFKDRVFEVVCPALLDELDAMQNDLF